MQKRATLQPPHKHNSRTAPLRGGRYQPHRTRCKLVMTVSFIGISKKKKELVENFSGKRPDVSKKFVQILRKFVQIFCRTCGEYFSSRRMLMQTSAEKQHDVEYGNNDGNGVKHKRTPPRVGILPHDAP